jgi:ureidoacrylate peracid hydrolase
MQSASRRVAVDARPEAVTLDPAKSAVIVVDMQNDFGADGGMFALAGIDISPIQGVVAPISHVLAAARRSGMTVVYLKMGFDPDLSNTGGPEAPNWFKCHQPFRVGEPTTAPDGSSSRVLIRDTWNTEIVPELAPEPGDLVVYKHRFSGFFETELDELLKGRSIKQLIFTGCTTSVCVESTVRDAFFRDYISVILEDCVAEPIGADLPRTNHEATLLVMQALFSWVSGSEQLVSALEGQAVPVPS